jgi:hypothetical protein
MKVTAPGGSRRWREKIVKTVVKRDGVVQAEFEGDDPVKNNNDAWIWLLKHQPMSVDWAMRYEGWEIVDLPAEG